MLYDPNSATRAMLTWRDKTKGELGPAQYDIDPPPEGRLLVWIAGEAFRLLGKMWGFSRRGLAIF